MQRFAAAVIMVGWAGTATGEARQQAVKATQAAQPGARVYAGEKVQRPSKSDSPCTAGQGPVINADGEIETTLPDGSKRITRPGVCGFTMVAPDGRRSTVSCQQVQVATPPINDSATEAWLDWHAARLLDVLRSLVGNSEDAVNNYLRRYESDGMALPDRIRIRTDAISKLLNPGR